MAIRSFPFNSINGDRKFNAFHWTEYFNWLVGNGIFPNPSTNLQVTSNNNMTITVKKGAAWINGHIVTSDEDLVLSLEGADGLLNRIDRIALRLDVVDRQIIPIIKKGDPATVSSAKPLQRDDDAYELGLADIRIDKGAISISQSNITDLRLNKNYCGVVHGLVDQVDTTTLFNQYQSWINNKKDEFDNDLVNYTDIKKQEFESWIILIKDILDESVAGNLLNMIEAIPKVLSGSTEPSNLRAGDIWLRELN